MEGKVYAQLYSLLRTNQEDLLEALKELSAIGYDGLELLGIKSSGLKPQEYRRLLEEFHLDPISTHGLKDEEDMDFAREVGVRFTDIRAEIAECTRDNVLRACEEMNEQGRILKKHGIRAVLHNHSLEMRWMNGEEGKNRVYDVLISNTDPTLVNFEFDVGWGAFAGVDPVEYVRKYPGRFPLIHVKEALRTATCADELAHFPAKVLEMGMPHPPKHPDAGTDRISKGFSFFLKDQAKILYESRSWNGKLGTGIIDWPTLVKECVAQGTEAFISEREYYSYPGGNDDPVTCAKHDYEYLRSL